VPAWLKRQAYAEYGVTQYKTGDYEVDHLITLSLGGSNSIRNLWPQSTKTSPWNSYVKDPLERKLHKLRMRRPIGPQDRSKRDSVKLDRSRIRRFQAGHERETGRERQLKDIPHPKALAVGVVATFGAHPQTAPWREPLARDCRGTERPGRVCSSRYGRSFFPTGPRKQSFRAVSRKVWRQRLHGKWW
jgi:hypothetical protein